MDRRDSSVEMGAGSDPLSDGDEIYRLMVAAAADVVMFVTDAEGRVLVWPAGAVSVLIRAEHDVVGRDVRSLLEQPDSATEDFDLVERKGVCQTQRWFVRGDRSRVLIQGSIRRIVDGRLLWTGMDVTSDRRELERQKTIVSLLQHSIRNLLANVRAIVQRSSRTSDTVEDLSMHLEGRIDSIARTQLMLARNLGAEIDLEDIIRDELVANAVPDDQVEINGPQVGLSSKAAEILTFAVHELSTNAVKWGALRNAKGKIAVEWNVEQAGGESRLHFSWTERGVQIAAVSPRRIGFGSELITDRVPYELSGTGTFELHPGGLRATLVFPLRPGNSILAAGDARASPGHLSRS